MKDLSYPTDLALNISSGGNLPESSQPASAPAWSRCSMRAAVEGTFLPFRTGSVPWCLFCCTGSEELPNALSLRDLNFTKVSVVGTCFPQQQKLLSGGSSHPSLPTAAAFIIVMAMPSSSSWRCLHCLCGGGPITITPPSQCSTQGVLLVPPFCIYF